MVVSPRKHVKRSLEWLLGWELCLVPTLDLSQCHRLLCGAWERGFGVPQPPLGALPGSSKRSMSTGSSRITPPAGGLSTWLETGIWDARSCPEVWADTWEGERGSTDGREKQEKPGRSVELAPCRNLSCCSQAWLLGHSFAREQMALGSPVGSRESSSLQHNPRAALGLAELGKHRRLPNPRQEWLREADGAWADSTEWGSQREGETL